MDAFRIQGGTRLSGRTRIHGSKNASLPLMAAAILADGPTTIRGIPPLSDIVNMQRLLAELGCSVNATDDTCRIENVDRTRTHARYDIVRTMRASICVLGPLLARRRHAKVSMPGGCAFGHRPIDLHLRGLKALGARITLDGGNIIATADRLRGTSIFLGGPFGSTVLGTANVLSAATLAKGKTIIESAACEPEIVDLANMLNSMGAKISGAGTHRIMIEGVEQLDGCVHDVIPDRIVAGTYAIAAGMTNGDVILEHFPYDHLMAVIDTLKNIGVHIQPLDRSQHPARCTVRVTSERRLRPAIMTTQPYPGFPTDLQAQLLSLLCLADGNSIVTEKIYPERFMHVAELTRMGAAITRNGPIAIVEGVRELVGAPVMASDLRASASLILAAMVARGETLVSRVYHLDRGYWNMDQSLNELGARVERIQVDPSADLESELASTPSTSSATTPHETSTPAYESPSEVPTPGVEVLAATANAERATTPTTRLIEPTPVSAATESVDV